MNENRLPDYLDHMLQAAADARSFVERLTKSGMECRAFCRASSGLCRASWAAESGN